MSLELATISQDLPIELNLDALILSDPDRKAAFDLFAELEFKSLMREFLEERSSQPSKGEWLAGAAAAGFLENLSSSARFWFTLRFQDGVLGRKTVLAACVQGESGPPAAVDLRDSSVAQQWASLMESANAVKVCWDAKLCTLAQESGRIRMRGPMEDVMLMAFLTSPHIGDYSLRRWALEQLHLSLPAEKGEQTSLEALSQETMAEGLFQELDAIRRLFEILRPRLDECGLRPLYQDIELPLIPVLADMERAGIRVDPMTLRELSLNMEQQLTNLTARIYQAAGTEFNINSPKQLGEILFEKLNLPSGRKTRKTGGYSTDQAVLEELADSYEIPKLILDYRQLTKLKSTYVDALPVLINPTTGRVHTSFNQTGAATGRLSSSDPNLQNIPIRTDLGREIRRAFIPEKGNLLVAADYSQVELRVLAHLSEDQVLIDAFLQDQDIHERTALEVFGEAARIDRAEYRRRAKVINFGIVYGLSAFGLAQRLGIGREEAQAFINAYFERYKGVRAWLDKTIEETRKTGRVQTMFGRIRPIPDIHSKEFNTRQFAERTAINTPIQGTAADIIKIAMVRVHHGLQAGNFSAKILLQVHDELVLESPQSEVPKVRDLVRLEMENAASLRVPLRVDMNTASNWKDMK